MSTLPPVFERAGLHLHQIAIGAHVRRVRLGIEVRVLHLPHAGRGADPRAHFDLRDLAARVAEDDGVVLAVGRRDLRELLRAVIGVRAAIQVGGAPFERRLLLELARIGRRKIVEGASRPRCASRSG